MKKSSGEKVDPILDNFVRENTEALKKYLNSNRFREFVKRQVAFDAVNAGKEGQVNRWLSLVESVARFGEDDRTFNMIFRFMIHCCHRYGYIDVQPDEKPILPDQLEDAFYRGVLECFSLELDKLHEEKPGPDEVYQALIGYVNIDGMSYNILKTLYYNKLYIPLKKIKDAVFKTPKKRLYGSTIESLKAQCRVNGIAVYSLSFFAGEEEQDAILLRDKDKLKACVDRLKEPLPARSGVSRRLFKITDEKKPGDQDHRSNQNPPIPPLSGLRVIR